MQPNSYATSWGLQGQVLSRIMAVSYSAWHCGYMQVLPGALSISSWKSKYAIHALQETSPLLTILLRRYTHRHGVYQKVRTTCALEAGELVCLPVFLDGLSLTHVKYWLIAVTYHLGDTPYSYSGHYKTALSVAESDARGQMSWSFYILDDGRPPMLATSHDIQEILGNSYIRFLCKCGPHE